MPDGPWWHGYRCAPWRVEGATAALSRRAAPSSFMRERGHEEAGRAFEEGLCALFAA